MKIMNIAGLLLSGLFIDMCAMELQETLAQQLKSVPEMRLFEGNISGRDYLSNIEEHPERWGFYSAKLRALRTADYRNYHIDLYDFLVDIIDDSVVPTIRRFVNRSRMYANTEQIVQVINTVSGDIREQINLLYHQMKMDMKRGLIKKGKST